MAAVDGPHMSSQLSKFPLYHTPSRVSLSMTRAHLSVRRLVSFAFSKPQKIAGFPLYVVNGELGSHISNHHHSTTVGGGIPYSNPKFTALDEDAVYVHGQSVLRSTSLTRSLIRMAFCKFAYIDAPLFSAGVTNAYPCVIAKVSQGSI